MSPHVVLLAGAGFSKWSCDLPLVSELFDFKVHPDNAIEERRLTRLEDTYRKWRISNPDDHNEAFILFSQGRPNRFNLTNWYITRRLSEEFVVHSGRRYTWYINSYHSQLHDGIKKARELFDSLRQSVALLRLGIITTNYDLITEYALGTRGFNYGKVGEQIGYTPYPYPQPVYAVGETPIAKLHGSISWDDHRRYPDCRCGLTGKCLIVPPVTEKKAPKLLRDQWGLARLLLRNCSTLIVFGFSFNDYDQAIRKFFADETSPGAKVILVDVANHKRRLSSIFGHRTITYMNAQQAALSKRLSRVLRQ